MPSPSRARAPCWRAEVLLACYGGTFDPVHRGHVAIALAVADALQAPVRLLPAADPPHRAPPGASASQRAQMLDLAVDGEARLCVDRRELDRDGPSYTLDTLVDLRREFGPEVALVWVLGMDSVCDLHRWHRWKELLDHAHLLGVERPGASVGQGALAQASPEVAAELEGRRCTPLDLQRRASGGTADSTAADRVGYAGPRADRQWRGVGKPGSPGRRPLHPPARPVRDGGDGRGIIRLRPEPSTETTC